MKQFFRRCAAALCAGLMLTACPLFAVHAEETVTLPSGRTLAKAEQELNELAAQNNGSDDYDAAALVGIFHGDEVLYTNYFGYSDIANNIPADEDACFEWGSISKTFIWVSAFQLWEQGKLDLDRDVRGFFVRTLKPSLTTSSAR